MGSRYFMFRLFYEWKKTTGILKTNFPTNPEVKEFISLEDWKKQNNTFFFTDRSALAFEKVESQKLKEKATRILDGSLLFFNATWYDLPNNYDWCTNPVNGYKYSTDKHWLDIPDYSTESGDIKYVWEKSRFSYLLTIIKYDYHYELDHSAFVFSEIDHWIEKNPINQGPNWRCSQEMSLRLFNWMFAFHFYKHSKEFTKDRWEKYQHVIYWQVHHIYNNINFSRIAVRNNHAITETLLLAVSDILFPFIPETKRWAAKGRKWFEQEVNYQIYEDGTYLQFSMNYHRVVVQLLTFGIRLSELNGEPFDKSVYERAKKSIHFLYTCQTPGGFVPNYGNNDGALFFPWSDDFLDYRPQLEALHRIITGQSLYDEVFEDVNWWGWDINKSETKIKRKEGISQFSIGGYLIVRDAETLTFLRVGNHEDRPGQADNLHIDIWVGDENVIMDGGTYSYNADADALNYFFGTASHNTVMLENHNQMLKGDRFIWYYWTQADKMTALELGNDYILEGEVKVFGQLDNNITHLRKVKKSKGRLLWVIEDQLLNAEGMRKYQLWHGREKTIQKIKAKNEGEQTEKSPAFISKFYGQKEEISLLKIPFDNTIATTLDLQ